MFINGGKIGICHWNLFFDWVPGKFTIYPQSLVVQLDGPSHVSQIQVLIILYSKIIIEIKKKHSFFLFTIIGIKQNSDGLSNILFQYFS